MRRGIDPELVDRMKWFTKGSYSVVEKGGEIRFYNLQVDMQGTRPADGYLAPTAFFYAITPSENGGFELVSKRHPKK